MKTVTVALLLILSSTSQACITGGTECYPVPDDIYIPPIIVQPIDWNN